MHPTSPSDETSREKPDFSYITYPAFVSHISNGGYISSKEIANAISRSPDRPIPRELNPYIADLLAGKIAAPAGRPKDFMTPGGQITPFAIADYRRLALYLKYRKKRQGLKGWSILQGKEWWQGPPAERAARIVKAKYKLNYSWRTLQNKASRQNGL